jgi:hypothetical protein
MTEPDVADIPAPRPLEPLTEWILRRLGGRRAFWIVLWSAVPLLSPFIFSTVRFVAVVITGVITSLIVRALFAAIGF